MDESGSSSTVSLRGQGKRYHIRPLPQQGMDGLTKLPDPLAVDDPNFESHRGDIVGNYTEIKPYPIPYRCLYSRNISNLFMAGRNISVTHVALAPVRVMNTTAQMGSAVGRAAFLCRKLDAEPRALYTTHLAELLAFL